MSIERDGQHYKLRCDICLKADKKDFRDFHGAVAHGMARGWESRRVSGGRIDACPSCGAKMKQEDNQNEH